MLKSPKTPRRIRNQDYNHVIGVKVRSGYGSEGGGGEIKVFSLKEINLKSFKNVFGGGGRGSVPTPYQHRT